jgi:prepilin-type N-terminal cleavage/methylation domain-containing protein
MRPWTNLERKHSDARRGYTLVEVMVVVAIITILAVLVAGVVMKAVEAMRTTNTQTVMHLAESSLNQQLKEIVDRAQKSGKEVQEMKNLIRQAFPPTFKEINDIAEFDRVNGTRITHPPYLNFIRSNANLLASLSEKERNSALLRLILEKGPYSRAEVDQFPKGTLVDVRGVGILIDSWGDPIQFKLTLAAGNSYQRPVFEVLSDNAVASK